MLLDWIYRMENSMSGQYSPLLTHTHTHTVSKLSTPSICWGILGSLRRVHVEGPSVIDPDWASQEEIPACHWPTLLHVSTLLLDHQRQSSPSAGQPAGLREISDCQMKRGKWTYYTFCKITSRSCLSTPHRRFSGLVTVKTSPHVFIPSLLLLKKTLAHRLLSSSK